MHTGATNESVKPLTSKAPAFCVNTTMTFREYHHTEMCVVYRVHNAPPLHVQAGV